MYTVYQTTCTMNGKFYIGVHKTDNPYDDYLGSGKILKSAIEKYGRKNFVKIVLFIYENKDEAFKKEEELVNQSLVQAENCYNLKLGGQGGWEFNNDGSERHITRCSKGAKTKNSLLTKSERQEIGRKASISKWKNNRDTMLNNQAKAAKTSKSKETGIFSKKALDNRKAKYKKIKHQSGEQNSQYGKIWVTNGEQNLKVDPINIPEGFHKGRKIK